TMLMFCLRVMFAPTIRSRSATAPREHWLITGVGQGYISAVQQPLSLMFLLRLRVRITLNSSQQVPVEQTHWYNLFPSLYTHHPRQDLPSTTIPFTCHRPF